MQFGKNGFLSTVMSRFRALRFSVLSRFSALKPGDGALSHHKYSIFDLGHLFSGPSLVKSHQKKSNFYFFDVLMGSPFQQIGFVNELGTGFKAFGIITPSKRKRL